MGNLLVVGAVAWVASLLMAVLIAIDRDDDDPVNGISRSRLAVLGILGWPVVFVSITSALAWLFPFESTCNPPGTSISADLNCRLGWSLVMLLVAVVVATGAIVLVVRRVHVRQANARDVQTIDGASRP